MFPYIEQQLSRRLSCHITRHMLGMFQNIPGARQWRRHISEKCTQRRGRALKLLKALAKIPYQDLGV